MQEATHECINKWDNNAMFLSLLSSLSLSLSESNQSVNKIFKKEFIIAKDIDRNN